MNKDWIECLNRLDRAAEQLESVGLNRQSQSITLLMEKIAQKIELDSLANLSDIEELTQAVLEKTLASPVIKEKISTLLDDFLWGLRDRLYPYSSNKLNELEVMMMDEGGVPEEFDLLCRVYRVFKKHNPVKEEI